MRRVPRKPLASERTVDMFSGVTAVEAREAAEVDKPAAEFDKERNRSGFVEDGAMVSDSPHKTDSFGSVSSESNQYRVVLSGDHFYLEQLRYTPSGVGAYAYAGVMFPARDLASVLSVIESAKGEYDEKQKT